MKYKISKFILTLATSVGVLAAGGQFVFAEGLSDGWSWVNSNPTVYLSEKIENMAPTMCPNYYQTKAIDGYPDLKKICLTMGDTVKFGTFYADYAFRAAVGFSYDTKMYKVNGVCSQHDNCLYLPDTDTLVTKQYLINGIVRSLVVYRNFSTRLKQRLKIDPLAPIEYDFDSSNPDYIFKSHDSVPYAWPIGGVGASANGKWLAVEFRQRGVGLLNIDTLEMKRVSNKAYSYNSGMNSMTEFAVSNDGRHIAIVGLNSGLTLYEVGDSCGDEPTDERMRYVLPVANKCKTSVISTGDFIYRFNYAVQPSFDPSGGELRFFATSYVGEIKKVVLRAAGYEPQSIEYLALGDSFSSGEGEESDAYYLNGTNDEYEKCHVSARSYPFLVAAKMGIDPGDVRNIACSGAVIRDVIGIDEVYFGQDGRLGRSKAGYDDISIELSKDIAVRSFLPGRIHQESFLSEYKPRVITVGIGGNDVGFMEKIKECISPLFSCQASQNSEQLEQTMNEIKSLFYRLVEMYTKLHQASPDTKIYALGYPKIINDQQCRRLGDMAYVGLLDSKERVFMNQGVKYLNLVIKQAAKAAGVGYLDIQDSLGNKVVCGSDDPSAVNTIRFGDDSAPFTDNRKFFVVGNEGFHPNSIGHTLVADSILNQTDGGLLSYNYCQDGSFFCPDNAVVPPNPDSESIDFWLPDGKHDLPKIQKQDIVFDKPDNTDEFSKRLVISPMSLKPGSTASLEIHSDVVTVESFVVSDDGSLSADIVLPSDLGDGYHAYHLYGTSYMGEAVDIYQTFVYMANALPAADVSEDVVPPDETIAEVVDDDMSSVNDKADSGADDVNKGKEKTELPTFQIVDDARLLADNTSNKPSMIATDNKNTSQTNPNQQSDASPVEVADPAVLGEYDISSEHSTVVDSGLIIVAVFFFSALSLAAFGFIKTNLQ